MSVIKSALALSMGSMLLLLASGGVAVANGNHGGPKGPGHLHGDYAFTGSGSCLAVIGGQLPAFDKDLHPMPGRDSFIVTFTVQGIRTFHRNGTGTVVGKVIGTSFEQTNTNPPAASSHEFEATFDYTLDHDGFLSVATTSYTGMVMTGPRRGQTLVIEGLDFSGTVSIDKKTITLATPDTAVEAHTYFDGVTQVAKHQRICHRSRIGIRIKD